VNGQLAYAAAAAGIVLAAACGGDEASVATRLETETVPETANIFGAGRAQPPEPAGGGAGTPPPSWRLPDGARTASFPEVTGSVTPNVGDGRLNGPEGDREGVGGQATDVSSWGGISGIVDGGGGMFLVGVFLTDVEPSEPTPERLDFTGGEEFDELAPQTGQTFYVGDGRGRTYRVPEGATRLFVGFADAFLYRGDPGWYGNNDGALRVTVEASK
jgi:hypothetical protein